jgi:N-acetylglutamate synthase-like GNAT family acetyltransferase
MDITIRRAVQGDVGAISRVIISALRETNVRDYSAEIIARVERNFSAEHIETLLSRRTAFVAVAGGEVVGTASLEGGVVRTVFVRPDCHRLGIGRNLMAAVIGVALGAGLELLIVPSSLSAVSFYESLGFVSRRECHEGDERTVVMELDLKRPEGGG